MIARWIEMDPLDQFCSPYLYVGNSPIGYYDLDGMQSTFWHNMQTADYWNLVLEKIPENCDRVSSYGSKIGMGIEAGGAMLGPLGLPIMEFGNGVSIGSSIISGTGNLTKYAQTGETKDFLFMLKDAGLAYMGAKGNESIIENITSNEIEQRYLGFVLDLHEFTADFMTTKITGKYYHPSTETNVSNNGYVEVGDFQTWGVNVSNITPASYLNFNDNFEE